MTRIFIENFEVDLTNELSQQITFGIDDIRKIDSKTTTFSKTIILPGTQNNNRLFGDIYELTRGNESNEMGQNLFYNFNPSRSASARFEINGLLIMKGIARLLSIKREVTAIEYEIALFGELGGFISALGTAKIEDLDFRQYDHVWDAPTIVGTWSDIGNTITGVDIGGPYSSIIYNPPIDFISFTVAGQIPWLAANDEFTVSGTSYNDGIYTAFDVNYISYNNTTEIIVIHYLGQQFTPENAAGGVITKNRVWGAGFVYPLIDYGVQQPATFPVDQDLRNFRPALFVREYMIKIIRAAGFTYESTFFETPLFRRLIIPNNDAILEKRGTATQYVYSDKNNFSFFKEGDLLPPGSPATYGSYLTYFGEIPIDWNIISLNSFSTISISGTEKQYGQTTPGPTATNGGFIYNGGSTTSIKITVKFDFNITIIGKCTVLFQLKRRRSNTDEILNEISPADTFSGRWGNTIDFSTSAENNDIFFIECKIIIIPKIFSGILNSVRIESGGNISTIEISPDPPGWIPYVYGETIEVNKTIPKNIYQKDFFLSVVKMFNLMITEDPNRVKHLKLTPYIDFYNPDPGAYIDWSYKISRDKSWLIKPMSEANARIYDFKYKEDNDYFNETYKKKWNEVYGNKTFDNNLEFSKDKATVELIFSPSILVGYNTTQKVFPAIYKFDPANDNKTAQGHNIRIMQIKYFDEIETWNIYDGTTPLTNDIKNYLYCGHYDNPNEPLIDINWGVTRELYYTISQTSNLQNNLFFLFYSAYMAEIIDPDSKLLTADFYLNENDIYNIDFSKLITIDGALFRLQKIIDWTRGELCKSELLRVINTNYPLPAPVSGNLFRLRWEKIDDADVWINGDRNDVNNWNSFFGINSAATKFATVFTEGNIITLMGYCRFGIAADLFRDCNTLTGIFDDLGCIELLGVSSFQDCDNLKEARFINLYKTYSRAFYKCDKLEVFKSPTAVGIANQTFQDCVSLKYLDLSGLSKNYQPTDFCGDDLNNNDVFTGISNNNITFYLSFAAYNKQDADIMDLINNNHCQLILV